MKWNVVINVSGGKDSTVAVLETLSYFPKEDIRLCWQDTGAEYLETEEQVKLVAKTFDLPLVILRSEGFDTLVRRKGFFPTPSYRQCTLYLKNHLFEKWVTSHRTELGDLMVVNGIRAEESQARANSPIISPSRLSTKAMQVVNFHPILALKEQQVFDIIKAEGLPLHPCYEFSTRCSCWCCIFQRKEAVKEYARLHPELYEQVCLLEDEVQHKWKSKLAINDLFK